MPPRRFSSWALLGIPGGLRTSDASLGLPLTKPVCVVPREVAPRGWRHLHSWRPRTRVPLRRHPKRLFVQGRALAFVAASHLNDKDVPVGRAGVAQSPVEWAGGGQTEVPLCPHIGERRGRIPTNLCPASPRCRISELKPAHACGMGSFLLSLGSVPAGRRVGASCCWPCHMPTCWSSRGPACPGISQELS